MKKIFVTGHQGMVGSSLLKELSKKDNVEIITATKKTLDLTDQKKVEKFLNKNRPDEVYLSAAKVGGISANNSYPADFISINLKIQINVIMSSFANDTKKLLFLGSSCIYPRLSNQPIKESYLLTGDLEETNEPYAIAKISGLKLCESLNRQYGTDFRSIMPTNLYGPRDNFHDKNSHVIPGLIKRIHDAKINKKKSVKIWGTGKPKREFLFVDDLAKAAIFLMDLPKSKFYGENKFKNSHINVGTGLDITIKELAFLIQKEIDYQGELLFDTSISDGTPRKLLDIDKLNSLGWKHQTNLKEGIKKTYLWFLNNTDKVRA
jgi:GDP-L-fucose synthase